MLSAINSSIETPVCYNKNLSYKGKYKTCLSKNGESPNVVSKKISSCTNNFNFRTLFAHAAKLFGRTCEFNESGKLASIERYVNDELKIVKHYNYGLFRPSSIDEYRNGLISKVTMFFKSPYREQWVIEYSTDGNNRIREYFPTGGIKMLQYEKDDNLHSIVHFDKKGYDIACEMYNPDETLNNVIRFNKDNTVNEYYDHGILMLKNTTYKYKNLTQSIAYDKEQNIQYMTENGNGYNTYYHYSDGKQDWSETKYKSGNILYKKIEYDKQGNPLTESCYDKSRILCLKKEYTDSSDIVTRYNTEGQVIAVETTDKETGNVSIIQYMKLK